MSVLMIPDDDVLYPTLGPQVCDFIEAFLCHGPGDLLGQPVVLNDEQRGWFYRFYEVEPQRIGNMANPRAGRRRFQRCALSLRKGSSKTELAAWLAIAELHPDGPVRCDGFDASGNPVGRSVTDPYIPMISYTEEQTEELAYGAMRRILEEMPIGADFDIGLGRIMRLGGDGKAEAVSASPNGRDGARTTFQHADETHRFTLDRLKDAWLKVMLANMAKRPIADPWALETTTAPAPGEGSVAETTMEYARAVKAGRAKGSNFFFFHRQASEKTDVSTPEGLRAAVVEASGPYIAQWSDVDRIAAAFDEPDADRPYLERVWLNRLVQATGKAFDIDVWRARVRIGYKPAPGAAITLGFDGGRFDDNTALVATEIETGHQWPVGIWAPPNTTGKTREEAELLDKAYVADIVSAVADVFETYHVTRFYCDPPKWESWIAQWAGKYGEEIVAEWWTNRRKPMAYAIRSFITAMTGGDLSHDGDKLLDEHIGNARQDPTGLFDEEEKPLWILKKDRPDSPRKIDGSMAAVLSWEARNDAVAAGEGAVANPYMLMIG
jgi:phage terminase large subunit-like protein